MFVSRETKPNLAANTTKRHPALLWFAVLCMLAIVSWILIDLFGPVPRYQLTSLPLAPVNSSRFINQLEALTGSPAVEGNHVEALANGTEFYETELQAVSQATKSVNWESYIFSRGEMAQRVVDALTERARAGVEVNLLMDAVGSLSTPKTLFTELRQAGGHVAWYHPVRWYNWPRANNRTHRELIVIDGRLGFLGGAGVADRWWHGENKKLPWRDTMFEVTGDAVRFLQGTFAENWLEASGQILIGDRYFVPLETAGDARSLVVASSPSQGGSTRARILFQVLIGSSQRSLEITTPYFLPDQSLRDELIHAVHDRHVRVQILVPGKHSDHTMTRSSSRSTYGDLLKAGVEIYEYEPTMIHAKILVVDDLWSVVGSSNIDHRSFGLNDEVNLAVLDPGLAIRLSRDFQNDLSQARRQTLDQWQHRPLWERATELLGRLFSREE